MNTNTQNTSSALGRDNQSTNQESLSASEPPLTEVEEKVLEVLRKGNSSEQGTPLADNDGYNSGPINIEGLPAPINALECMNNEPPELTHIIPGLLQGDVGILAGAGSSGKGLFCLQIALSFAGQLPLAQKNETDTLMWPLPKIWGAVAMLLAEDSEKVLHHRLYSIGKKWPKCKLAAPNVSIYSLKGIVMRLEEKNDMEGKKRLLKEILIEIGKKHLLIILDPIRRFHGQDENSSGAMTELVQILEEISKETGVTILLTHHVGKGYINGDTADQAASRGSSALVDAVRCVFNLAPMSRLEAKGLGFDENERHKWVKLISAKANYLPSDLRKDIWLKREEGGVLVYVPEGPVPKKSENSCVDSHDI